ncbi:MAG: sulfotransferase, partial [Deltaproteobacteria bacterium]
MIGPGSGSLAAARARIAALAARREPTPTGGLDRISEVIVLASSSRGGSSMFMELLRQHDGLIHLQAEFNPFLALVHRTWPDSGGDSDALDAADARLEPRTRARLER